MAVCNDGMCCPVKATHAFTTRTFFLLTAIAITDTLTGVFPCPIMAYFFVTEKLKDYAQNGWCFAYDYLTEYIPIIFHTASVWLTMALAVQRYICVCYPFKPRNCHHLRDGGSQSHMQFLRKGFQSCCFAVVAEREPNYHSLFHNLDTWLGDFAHVSLYYNIYFAFRVLFIHIIPCVSLIVLNALLLYNMRHSSKRGTQYLRQNKTSECQKLKDSNRTTLMLVSVVGIFMLVELPGAILMVIWMVNNTLGIRVIEQLTLQIADIFIRLSVFMTCPLNIVIYCGMSRTFRQTFKSLFTGRTY
ncbi:sex peptide receptor-like [Gigantopelta aegis]|uniref:sex peptide receptor-like n=1 Tax=Gigantopelta aegis TaxID=1735272 RepID=UPI001B88C310|nr:sex peptide receptor-like [Gigantopelta aegis]